MVLKIPADEIKTILNDKKSGSTYLSEKIEKVIGNSLKTYPLPLRQKTVSSILKAHSSMAAVINKLNWICLKAENKNVKLPADISAIIFRQFWQENREKKTWVILSNSCWVTGLIKQSTEKLQLKIGVSYPDKEGIKTADELSGLFKVGIYEDSNLCGEVERADGIILGADLLFKDYFVNKTGSFGLALAAKHFKKPLYIITSGDKYLPAELLPLFKLKIKSRGLRKIHYFEKVPLNLVDQVYLTSEKWDMPVSSLLQQILQT